MDFLTTLKAAAKQVLGGDVITGPKMLKGLTGGQSGPPARETKSYIEAYNNLPWLNADVGKIAMSAASVRWVLKAPKAQAGPVHLDSVPPIPPIRGAMVKSKRTSAQASENRYILRKDLKYAPRWERVKALTKFEENDQADEIPEHPALDLLNEPNELFNGNDEKALVYIYRLLVGEAFEIVDRSTEPLRKSAKTGRQLPTRLWPVPPHWVQSIPTPEDPYFRVSHSQLQIRIPYTEMLWDKVLNPMDPYLRGTGRVRSMTDELDADESAAKLMSYAFYNRGRPDVLVSIPGMSVEQLRAFKEDWLSSLMGPKNVNKAHFVNTDAKATVLGENFMHLQLKDLRVYSRDTIRQVLGIPPEVLGIIDNSNRSTIDAATYIFNEHVIIPLLEARRAFLQKHVIDEFDERLILDYVSPTDEDKQFALSVARSQPHMLRVNEWREMMGQDKLSPEEGGEKFIVSGQLQAIDSLAELQPQQAMGMGGPGPMGGPTPPPGAPGNDLNVNGMPFPQPPGVGKVPGIHSPETAMLSNATPDEGANVPGKAQPARPTDPTKPLGKGVFKHGDHDQSTHGNRDSMERFTQENRDDKLRAMDEAMAGRGARVTAGDERDMMSRTAPYPATVEYGGRGYVISNGPVEAQFDFKDEDARRMVREANDVATALTALRQAGRVSTRTYATEAEAREAAGLPKSKPGSVKLTPAQRTAFETSGILEAAEDDDEKFLASAIRGGKLHFEGEADRKRLAEAVNNLSNYLDRLSAEEPDKERQRWYERDAKTLGNLFSTLYRSAPEGVAKHITPNHGPDDQQVHAGGHSGNRNGSESDAGKGGRAEDASALADEPIEPPRKGDVFDPDPSHDGDGDGIADTARVGVPGKEIPPPPSLPRLPNLTGFERDIEEEVNQFVEANPSEATSQALAVFQGMAKANGTETLTFETDAAKALFAAWNGEQGEDRAARRSTLNTMLHQAANAVTKRAFLEHIKTLSPEQKAKGLLITAGGCGAGKGYALGSQPDLAASNFGVVWDSAGDQNGTETEWLREVAEKEGIPITVAFVHAEPVETWSAKGKGVVERAMSPKNGRMVDARVFADSHVLGRANMDAFVEKHKDNPMVKIIAFDNAQGVDAAGKPKPALRLDSYDKLPKLEVKANDLYERCLEEIYKRTDLPPRVRRGATLGFRIWGQGKNAQGQRRPKGGREWSRDKGSVASRFRRMDGTRLQDRALEGQAHRKRADDPAAERGRLTRRVIATPEARKALVREWMGLR